jgi:hypothetical protein
VWGTDWHDERPQLRRASLLLGLDALGHCIAMSQQLGQLQVRRGAKPRGRMRWRVCGCTPQRWVA